MQVCVLPVLFYSVSVQASTFATLSCLMFFLFSTSVVVKVHFDFPLSLAFFGPAEADWLTEGRDQAQGRR